MTSVFYDQCVLLAKLYQLLSCFILYSKAKFACCPRCFLTFCFCIPDPYNEKDIFLGVGSKINHYHSLIRVFSSHPRNLVPICCHSAFPPYPKGLIQFLSLYIFAFFLDISCKQTHTTFYLYAPFICLPSTGIMFVRLICDVAWIGILFLFILVTTIPLYDTAHFV